VDVELLTGKLAAAQGLKAAHAGRLWAANNTDRGASFYFTLPARSSG